MVARKPCCGCLTQRTGCVLIGVFDIFVSVGYIVASGNMIRLLLIAATALDVAMATFECASCYSCWNGNDSGCISMWYCRRGDRKSVRLEIGGKQYCDPRWNSRHSVLDWGLWNIYRLLFHEIVASAGKVTTSYIHTFNWLGQKSNYIFNGRIIKWEKKKNNFHGFFTIEPFNLKTHWHILLESMSLVLHFEWKRYEFTYERERCLSSVPLSIGHCISNTDAFFFAILLPNKFNWAWRACPETCRKKKIQIFDHQRAFIENQFEMDQNRNCKP